MESFCIVAGSHSNTEEQPDAPFAFAEKPTIPLTFRWIGYQPRK
jgi:hypothetical protein